MDTVSRIKEQADLTIEKNCTLSEADKKLARKFVYDDILNDLRNIDSWNLASEVIMRMDKDFYEGKIPDQLEGEEIHKEKVISALSGLFYMVAFYAVMDGDIREKGGEK